MAKEYWFCIIGIVDRKELPNGSDTPLRFAVKKAFKELLNRESEICSSGWGINEKGFNELQNLSINSENVITIEQARVKKRKLKA